jgi:hypothetical protein
VCLGQRKRLGASKAGPAVEWATGFCTAILSAEEDELCNWVTHQAEIALHFLAWRRAGIT